ncbi:dTDP-4-dehydrorhamnose 3,5-epimerase [Corynebacterium freiburgense]|uniref:dTDP-4-dehydrorhamnose 3,5-epimerase n=1 Tax=Corynebacterium freiburgense TaxID=556548 RepID=UPI0004223E5E|nr:dTDP-4-dehydrorhamnose 3,5-epimerase [Corynebacterium freiburgense]WJZ01576.1 dTDP-4-dehydrorhamnose 3,5-epimerase [Corynebacterium freiburgense]
MLRELELPGVYVNEPVCHSDQRGTFHEWFRAEEFQSALGYRFELRQANMSTSTAGVLRGMHYAEVPPGQAKFVICPVGRILDIVVDIRTGSPTFGKHIAVELSEQQRNGMFIPIGFAHGFLALEDSTVAYLTTAEYSPQTEHTITPFDTNLALPWPEGDHILSPRDTAAATLFDAPLPTYAACLAYEQTLREA